MFSVESNRTLIHTRNFNRGFQGTCFFFLTQTGMHVVKFRIFVCRMMGLCVVSGLKGKTR